MAGNQVLADLFTQQSELDQFVLEYRRHIKGYSEQNLSEEPFYFQQHFVHNSILGDVFNFVSHYLAKLMIKIFSFLSL